MKPYQRKFVQFAIDNRVLCFGNFTLKSGRQSPYFFNSGLFNSGALIARLGSFYAAALHEADIGFDIIYGPAYKGIPLAVATTIAFANEYQNDIPYAFNRKEIKDHGEGGQIVGAPLSGKVVIVDDVISAGTSIRESVTVIEKNHGCPAAVLIALDRQERGQGANSAIQEIEQQFAIPVISIISYLKTRAEMQVIVESMQNYRAQYGV